MRVFMPTKPKWSCFIKCNSEDSGNAREAFVFFLNVRDTTGEGLMEAFLKKSNNLGIDTADIRGQVYDNREKYDREE